MKKTIGLLLALVLALTVFSACGKGQSTASDADGQSNAGTAESQSGEDMPSVTRLTLVVDGAFGDGGIYDSAKEGCERLEAEGLVEVTTVECGSGDFSAGLREAGKSSDLVVCVSREPFSIETTAAQYPDVHWICIDDPAENTPANVLNLCFKQNEGAFLAGYIAASFSKTGTVGAVGAGESPVVSDYILGFEQGARYFREDTTVLYDFAADFSDPASVKDCALELNAEGADVILQAAGAAGSGVFAAAGEKGFYVVGTDADQRQNDPDHILCSVVKSVGDAVYLAVKSDDMWGQSYVGGLADGLVSLSYGDGSLPQPVSEEVRAEVAQITAGILDGSIVVDGVIR